MYPAAPPSYASGLMYGEWYGVCNFAVDVCVDCGGVYMFYVFSDCCVVYGVDVCDVVCVVECFLSLAVACL